MKPSDSPTILLTNDDGIHAPGLMALARSFGRVFGPATLVVAPASDRSAIGHGTTIHREVRVEPVTLPGAGAVTAYAVEGTPVDCVKLGYRVLASSPVAMVVSGVNAGHNLGTDVFYSGTVSAAVEAAILALPGLAVSAPRVAQGPNHAATRAAELAVQLAMRALVRPLPPGTLLNLNVPETGAGPGGADPADLARLRICRLGWRSYRNNYYLSRELGGHRFFVLEGEDLDDEGQPDTDIAYVRAGYATLTPIEIDRNRNGQLEALASWLG